jgi:DNA polymerase-3 subunit epsilon
MNFLNNEVGFELPNKVTDTLEMAREAFPGQKNNLCALSERLKIKIKNSPFNGALLDTLHVCEVYKRLKNEQNKI